VRETVKNGEQQLVLSVLWNGNKHFMVQKTLDVRIVKVKKLKKNELIAFLSIGTISIRGSNFQECKRIAGALRKD